jgi:coenzyme F420-reducing hydrogenase delta subunit
MLTATLKRDYMKWYKYRIHFRSGPSKWKYVQVENIKEFLDELRVKPEYCMIEYFRADYEEVEKPPKEVLVAMIYELTWRYTSTYKRIEELSKLL